MVKSNLKEKEIFQTAIMIDIKFQDCMQILKVVCVCKKNCSSIFKMA